MKLPGQAIAMSRHHDAARAMRARATAGAGIGMSSIPCIACDIAYQICRNNNGGAACDIGYQICKSQCG